MVNILSLIMVLSINPNKIRIRLNTQESRIAYQTV